MSQVQVNDFNAIDKALLHLAFPNEFPRSTQRFFIQRSRGYSKSTDFASAALWLAEMSPRRLNGIVVADDREQAQFVRDAMNDLMKENPDRFKGLELRKKVLENPNNGVEISFASSDATSAFGGRPDLVIADELTHWKKNDLWATAFSSFGKRADQGAVLLVGCNAGWGRGWQWDIKQEAMSSELWYHSAPHGHSPWYSLAMIEEQRRILEHSNFRRLWFNEWQDSSGTFVNLEEADACIDDALDYRVSAEDIPPLADGRRVNTFVASLDYAEKHDRTVGTVMHQVDSTIIVDRMDVIAPELQAEGITPVHWCEEWVNDVTEKFGSDGNTVFFVIDPYQLVWLIHLLRSRLDFHHHIEEWNHHGGTGNFDLSRTLKHLILHKQIKWYAGCGVIHNDDNTPYQPKGMRDDLSTELSTLYVKNMQQGKWRLEHQRGDHDDRAFSLGAGCAFIVKYSDEWGLE